jgi:DNA primase large subunit
MDRLHARYPFLDAAREAVERADAGIETIAREERVVERAIDRIRATVTDGRTGSPHRDHRVELFSYPLARVLVSLVNDRGLVRAYADAEAATAMERLEEDAAARERRTVDYDPPDLRRFLREFDLDDSVRSRGDGGRHGGGTAGGTPETYAVAVTTYLRHAADRGDDWQLLARDLHDGWVTVDRDELDAIVADAIRDRVAAGLPLAVPDPVAAALDDAVDRVRETLGSVPVPDDIDAVDPALFPPCVRALMERVDAGEALPPHSAFSLVGFLAAVGMEADAIVERCAGDAMDADAVRRRVERLRDTTGAGDGTVTFAPPSCVTMAAYGDCVNKDDRCETIAHPLAYYEDALLAAGASDE